MSKLIFDISMSLDGFAAASGIRPEEPMGDGGQLLHECVPGADEKGGKVLAESGRTVGASIAGRRTHDLSIPSWGADADVRRLARRARGGTRGRRVHVL